MISAGFFVATQNEGRHWIAEHVDTSVEIAELVSWTAKKLSRYHASDETVNVTESFLLYVAEMAGSFPPSRIVMGLERLCRKVDIAKTVRTAYDTNWNKPIDRTPISLEVWPALIAAFLYRAARPYVSDRIEERGQSLRYLNSAFNALDLYEAAGGREVSALEESATRLLGQILRQ